MTAMLDMPIGGEVIPPSAYAYAEGVKRFASHSAIASAPDFGSMVKAMDEIVQHPPRHSDAKGRILYLRVLTYLEEFIDEVREAR